MAQGSVNGGTVTPAGLSVLLVDDDVELCELMQEFFARRGIRLETANDGRRGLTRALGGGHDLLLLDVMMPGLDGFELLRLIRRQSKVPVIMLTARTAQVDRVAGLDAGADDYLPKPFGPEELLARIRAVLRRRRRRLGPPARIDRGRWGPDRPGGPRGLVRRPEGRDDLDRVRPARSPPPLRRPDRLPGRADGRPLPAPAVAVRPGA